MPPVNTIADYIEAVRTLLQDEMEPYRYSDKQLKLGLTLGMSEAYRLRPDLFLRKDLPNYNNADLDTVVDVSPGYQSAFMYYMAGHAQLSDSEDVTDNRASIFLGKFTSQLLTPAS